MRTSHCIVFQCVYDRLLPECKDPSHFLFSGFVYSYLHSPFSSYTVNILNVSYYLTIERDLVQVGLMSKDPTSLHLAIFCTFKANLTISGLEVVFSGFHS